MQDSNSVKCSFRYIAAEEVEKFGDSIGLLTISVGQEYHEGDKFVATADLVNKRFRQYKIMLYDILQRYTMALTSPESPDYFYEIARKEGDLWLERNKSAYSNHTNCIDIIRWDHWLQHPDYEAKRAAVLTLMQKNAEYKASFDMTIDVYLKRYMARLDDVSASQVGLERVHRLCMDYLVEECAAICLWHESGADYEVYPNRRNPAMDATHRLIVLKEHPGKLYSVGVKFKKKGQLGPQKFCVESVE